jgi:exonuclease III
MKIVSWNCNMAFRKKAERVLNLKPDLLVIPECETPTRLDSIASSPNHTIWIGDNLNKGLGVLSYSDLTLRLLDVYDSDIKYVAPIAVAGKVNFTLLAVWAMDDKHQRDQRYIARVWIALHRYASLLEDPVLIMGDFNWNKIWDHSRNLRGNLTQTVDYLRSRNIVSLYHSFFGEEFGRETFPTLYMYRKQSRPYHVDYAFASRSFRNNLNSFRVGVYENWIQSSDHMPLILVLDE